MSEFFKKIQATKGQQLYSVGDNADSLYFLATGEVGLYIPIHGHVEPGAR